MRPLERFCGELDERRIEDGRVGLLVEQEVVERGARPRGEVRPHLDLVEPRAGSDGDVVQEGRLRPPFIEERERLQRGFDAEATMSKRRRSSSA